MSKQRICKWHYYTDDWDDYWETGCDQAFMSPPEGLKRNHFKYCPNCGRKIVVAENNTKEAER